MAPVQLRVMSVIKAWVDQTEDFVHNPALRENLATFFEGILYIYILYSRFKSFQF